MINNGKVLAIIPARGGSKRIPKKNIRVLNGKPLISWSIEAALKSEFIDEVVVSTDDSEIEKVSRKYDVKIHHRGHELSNDFSTTKSVIQNVLEVYSGFKYIVLLQPTSPLRTYKDINSAVEILMRKNADGIISVCEVDHPTQWINALDENMSMVGFLKGESEKRSQDYRKEYRLNGALYVVDTSRFLEENTFFLSSNIYAHLMTKEASVDIDEYSDLKLAEYYMEKVVKFE